MTRQELEAAAARQRSDLYRLEQKLARYKVADCIRDMAMVLTINNTTISGQGWSTRSDPALVKRVREMIAAAIEASET